VPGLVLLVSHTTLTFQSLRGQGSAALLTVTVAWQVTETLAGSSSSSQGRLQVPYGAPRVVSLGLDRTSAQTMECGVVTGEGRPVGADPSAIAVLRLQGTNFGNGSDVQVTVHGEPCAVHRDGVSRDRIVCDTQLCSGACVHWGRASRPSGGRAVYASIEGVWVVVCMCEWYVRPRLVPGTFATCKPPTSLAITPGDEPHFLAHTLPPPSVGDRCRQCDNSWP
jgi:hypothetical protein